MTRDPSTHGSAGSTFILIDHSIADLAGHHYQYAAHVLEAAERAGCRLALATNRKFAVEQEQPWPIYPVYEFGFWPNSKEGRLRAFWLSMLGWVQPILVFFRPLRSLLHRLAGGEVLPSFSHLREGGGKPERTARVAHSRTVLDGGPSAEALRHARSFARDTKKLFEQIDTGEGDVVFLPTVSHHEALGLIEFFKSSQSCLQATWHLVFRRSLREASEPDDRAQQKLNEIRDVFQNFKREAGGQRVYFYTDSDDLTRQYNQLGTAIFTTLPIPHTYSAPDFAPMEGPIRVTYLGDARGEKGFHLLPPIVHDLRKDYLAEGKVRFIIQSNYNTHEKQTRTVMARRELESFPASMVQLYKHVLAGPAYRKLLLASGIVLLPYDRAQYRERSSGILAEALAAGIPVIVPAGTWLSRQLPATDAEDTETLRRPSDTSAPAGSVGLCFHEPREIPDLIREIVDHYPHYRKTAAEFAGPWRQFHNAGRLVAEIRNRAQQSGPAVTASELAAQRARHSPG